MKRILLWNPYLDICGGGEKHVLQICQYFISHGYELTISWDADIHRDLERKLSLTLPIGVKWIPRLTRYGRLQKLRLTRKFDVVVYVTDGSYFFSGARHTIGFAMVPKATLYQMTPLNRLKTWGWTWISNSRFTQYHLKKWGIHSHVIYPEIEIPSDRLPMTQHTKGTALTFVSVGRFFKHLHSKRHDVAIAWFVTFLQHYPEFSYSKLILAGGLKDEDRPYYDSLKKLAQEYPNIVFRPNIPREELKKIYRHGDFYVHFSGWQIKEDLYPERTEHLGITPLEAMAYGCIPFGYAGGGITEVIKDGVNGYTFKSLDELSQKIMDVSHHVSRQESLRVEGIKTITTHFSATSLDHALQRLNIV